MNIFILIEKLIKYGIAKGLVKEYDRVYTRNKIIEVLGLKEIEEDTRENPNIEGTKRIHINNETHDNKGISINHELKGIEEVNISKEKKDINITDIKEQFDSEKTMDYIETIEDILEEILNWASENGRLETDSLTYRDILDTRLMECLTPRPSEVINTFFNLYKQNMEAATNYYYKMNQDINYLRVKRLSKDKRWKAQTPFGELDITINLSKPEKDPKEIAEAKELVTGNYPKCLLCRENEGYMGHIKHPARGNLRLIPLTLNNEEWYMQYSPYIYYNEHCIVLKGKHEPMKISVDTFRRLLDFVEQFPHYFLGSNADLPIVGGSILSHDHFQGGGYEFPMARAEIRKEYTPKKFNLIKIKTLEWPMSVIRIEGKDKEAVINAAQYIKEKWDTYSDDNVGIIANTKGVPHNTVTPIARIKNSNFELDLILRNNRTSLEHPEGIFHPHRELHNIKRENIGLIEAMGLAVLPSRLHKELELLKDYLLRKKPLNSLALEEEIIKHSEWLEALLNKYSEVLEQDVEKLIQYEVGQAFLRVLENSGVFKGDDAGRSAFEKFVSSL